jgi:hypothetical protein
MRVVFRRLFILKRYTAILRESIRLLSFTMEKKSRCSQENVELIGGSEEKVCCLDEAPVQSASTIIGGTGKPFNEGPCERTTRYVLAGLC